MWQRRKYAQLPTSENTLEPPRVRKWPRRQVSFLLAAVLLITLVVSVAVAKSHDATWTSTKFWSGLIHSFGSTRVNVTPSDEYLNHPISDLVQDAQLDFEALEASEPNTVADSAAAYRSKRNRHPPPGFDKWFEFAKSKSASVPELYFDQIYEDLEPFWAVDPKKIRSDAQSWAALIFIRGGKVGFRNNGTSNIAQWPERYVDMLSKIPAEHLPDVDLAMNLDDEPHIFVPWEKVNVYMTEAVQTQGLPSPAHTEIYNNYSQYPPPPLDPTLDLFPDSPSEFNIWHLMRETCHPGTENAKLEQGDLTLRTQFPEQQLSAPDGYVRNWTAARNVCENPHLRNLHGYLINPKEYSLNRWDTGSKRLLPEDRLLTRQLFPIFSTCKVQGNNDILIPAPMYWSSFGGIQAGAYDASDTVEWAQKEAKAVWRGRATGGSSKEDTFPRFHRHRFVSMLNGTQVELEQQYRNSQEELPEHVPAGSPSLLHNFPFPDASRYPLAALQLPQDLGRWIKTWGDGAFTFLVCWPYRPFWWNGKPECWYDDHWYSLPKSTPFSDFYKSKYLPDIDGMSYSGRFRSFLESSSLPIKATIWSEWHDKRLVPWKHFVPMTNTMDDFYGLMDYFIGYEPPEKSAAKARAGHDVVAQQIAQEGRTWAEKVLRQDDIVIYTWRLILEYARVCDERRQHMGFVDDIKQ